MNLHFDISRIDEPDLPDNSDFEDADDYEDYDIERVNDLDENDCFACHGTGEGYSSDSTCSFCNGRGTIKRKY